jgi:hypothetical protein
MPAMAADIAYMILALNPLDWLTQVLDNVLDMYLITAGRYSVVKELCGSDSASGWDASYVIDIHTEDNGEYTTLYYIIHYTIHHALRIMHSMLLYYTLYSLYYRRGDDLSYKAPAELVVFPRLVLLPL